MCLRWESACSQRTLWAQRPTTLGSGSRQKSAGVGKQTGTLSLLGGIKQGELC